MPTKSSLSKFRKKISYRFFKKEFESLIGRYEAYRKTFKGYYIYAIDGDELVMPRSKELLALGYRSNRVKENKESWYLKNYIVHTYDVVNRVSKAVTFSANQNELAGAKKMIPKLESNSITLYDRLYFCRPLVATHRDAGNKFIARLKSNDSSVKYMNARSKRYHRSVVEGVEVHTHKIKNKKTGGYLYLATNLARGEFLKKELAQLYLRRWEVETSFRDSTETLQQSKLHSKTENEILQEVYAHYWLINHSKVQLALADQSDLTMWLNKEYRRSSLKMVYECIIDSFKQLVMGQTRGVIRRMLEIIRRTQEKRKHLSRSAPRKMRAAGRKGYNYNGVTERNNA